MIKNLVVSLETELLDRNREFLRSLSDVQSKLDDSYICFEKLDVSKSTARQDDSEMTLDEYLNAMKFNLLLKLIAGKFPYDDKISISCRNVKLPETHYIERFFKIECQLNEKNFNEIDSIFTRIYGRRLA